MAMIDFTAAPAVLQTFPPTLRSPSETYTVVRTQRIEHIQRLLAAQMDTCLIVINVAERLPILSQEIIEAVPHDETMSILVRRLTILHTNLVELADLATQAKTVPISAMKT